MESEWMQVQSKRKKRVQKKVKVSKEPEPSPLIPNRGNTERRLMTPLDYTLTEEEKKMVNARGGYFCLCCENTRISNIIGRRIYGCQRCFCCVPDYDYGPYHYYKVWIDSDHGVTWETDEDDDIEEEFWENNIGNKYSFY